MNKILVTGSAGFIGYHLTKQLIKDGHEVVGLDNLNNYYDVKLKLDRLADCGIKSNKIAYNSPVQSNKFSNYSFIQLSIENAANLERLFLKEKFEKVCHLAAQAGVRYSIKNPDAYLQSNIVGFFNILEACRHNEIQHLVYASSSSVYGANTNTPFSEEDNVDNPISFYAATKKSNELMAHTYSHLYQIPTTGLRFFTVYGPWGRPDMAPMLFAHAIQNDQPIKVFNHGDMERDFTYVSDIVDGVVRVLNKPHNPQRLYRLYNIGNSQPTNLMVFIETIEKALGKKVIKKMLPMQAGDVKTTFADTSKLHQDFDYQPKTTLKEGIGAFINWYKSYFN